MKTIRYGFFLYVLAFAVFVASHFYFSRNQEFTYIGDNITYLTGSESAYYDHDFTIDLNDFKRFSNNHPEIPLEIPIIGKETTRGTFGVSKPLVFMMYFSVFTPIKDELLRAVVANSIIFSIWFAILYLLVRKIKNTWDTHITAVLLFTVLLFVSQANFYKYSGTFVINSSFFPWRFHKKTSVFYFFRSYRFAFDFRKTAGIILSVYNGCLPFLDKTMDPTAFVCIRVIYRWSYGNTALSDALWNIYTLRR